MVNINITIVIGITVILSVTLLSGSGIIPLTGKVVNSISDWTLQIQGKCPEVVQENMVSTLHEKTHLFGTLKYCHTLVKGEIINRGRYVALDTKINCIIKDKSGTVIVGKDQLIGTLKPNERHILNMKIYYNCGYEISEYNCETSFENPCP